MAYSPSLNTSAVYMDPAVQQTQPAYKPVVVSQPVAVSQPPLQQALPASQAYSMPVLTDASKAWGINMLNTPGTFNTIDSGALGLTVEPPPAHTGRAPVSPALYKQNVEPSLIALTQQQSYTKPHIPEATHSQNTGYQEPRMSQMSFNIQATSVPTAMSQQSSVYTYSQHNNSLYTMSNYGSQEQFNTNMSLQDLADISPEKAAISAHQNLGHNSPQMHNSPHAPAHHSPHPPAHHSPQVNASITSSIPAAPVAVQAVADSTTKPARRRSRKKTKPPPEVAPEDKSSIKPEPVMLYSMPQVTPYTESPPSQVVLSQRTVIMSPPSQYIAQSQMLTPEPMQQSIQAMPEGYATFEEPGYLNNDFGGTFVNPSEEMQTVIVSLNQEQQPVPMTDDLDEEFGHLSNENITATIKSTSNSKNKTVKPVPEEPVPGPSAPPPPPPKPKPVESTSFQNSFLSFLEGKKPETLSSVTNSTNVNKPVLPKYVPDTRKIIRKPETVREPLVSDEDSLSAVDQAVQKALVAIDDSSQDSQASSHKSIKATPRPGKSRRAKGTPKSSKKRVKESYEADMMENTPSPPTRRVSSARKAAEQGKQKLRSRYHY